MESSPRNDQQYQNLSYWHDNLPGSLAPRPGLENDIEVDVAIVGAGYTGLWTAYYLKLLKPGLSIAIIESEIAGYGASGRNGGWCSAYLTGMEKALARPDLRGAAIGLQKQLFDAVKEVGRVSSQESVDCHFDQSGHVEAAVSPTQLGSVREYVDFMHELGFGEEDFRWLSSQQLRERVNIDGALGGMYAHHCAAVHPARLARGLAEVVESKGVKIYEQTAVVTLDRHGLTTSRGRVETHATILATEGYTGSIRGLGRKLIPIHSMMIATEPLSEPQLEQTGLRQRFLFNNSDHITTYGQLTADNRIAFGCRGFYLFGARIKDHFNPTDPEFELVWQTLLKFFPSLSGSHFTHAWGGPMGVSRTLNPAVCFNPENRFGWAGGFFGNGVGACNLAGRTLADLILGRDTERVHTPWVNPEGERELDKKLWEIEPLRWLGINSRASLMQMADRAERNNSNTAPLINKALETLFP
jgi:glycine/D-amino acid oxidase-like deaminating enzyme